VSELSGCDLSAMYVCFMWYVVKMYIYMHVLKENEMFKEGEGEGGKGKRKRRKGGGGLIFLVIRERRVYKSRKSRKNREMNMNMKKYIYYLIRKKRNT